MAEVTLEALAARVAELERLLGVTPRTAGPGFRVRPGKGDMAATLEALRESAAEAEDTYDYDALREMDAVDIADQKRQWRESETTPGTGDWDAFMAAAEAIGNSPTYDWNAIAEQDAIDITDAESRSQCSSSMPTS